VTLREWLDREGVTVSEFARRLTDAGEPCTRQRLHVLAAGRHLPRLPLILEVERLTGGAVRPCDWLRPAARAA
jgi:hypothetical protein